MAETSSTSAACCECVPHDVLGPLHSPDCKSLGRPDPAPLREPLLPGEADSPLLDEDGWPILENASQADLVRAAQAVGALARYGNFLRAALAGIYAERRVAMRLRESGDCELHWGSCDA